MSTMARALLGEDDPVERCRVGASPRNCDRPPCRQYPRFPGDPLKGDGPRHRCDGLGTAVIAPSWAAIGGRALRGQALK
jgi:hypothetical protein